ncbi:DUF6597 domain-containing transcriptional factor [Gimesia aquarii]|uniref:Helix-turn-helix domain protein n=1 Tax=Gimesia aquarii TaxID=2527964 RepID=A0A517VYH1_9PLAN|nr:DUF6597 domain-containing transcriptional factor [Gimesia aquarii]QDT98057.1 Helix-turn-helix domain protein [Gimesia aquarii]
MDYIQERYKEQLPAKALRPYVDCFWSSLAPAHIAPVTRRILPDGCIDFIFDLSPSSSCEGKVVGTMTRPLLFQITDSVCLVAVRFRPGGAVPFLNFAADEVTDLQCELPREWRMTRLADRLRNETTLSGRIHQLESALLDRLAETLPVDKRVQIAVSMIEQGHKRIGAIANEVGTSRQHLNRLFRQHVGVGAKCFGRIVRLQQLLAHVETAKQANWSFAALNVGYYDQAHMVTECRSLTGLTPTELAAR